VSKIHDPLLKLSFLVAISQIKGISGVTMRVAVILTNAYNFESDKCWWSISQLAKKVQSSNKQVSTAIQTFKELKIFNIKSGRTGRANEYKPNFKIILQYPSLASKENLQKVEKFSTDQTININNKINTSKENISWGRKPVDPLSGFSNKPEGLEKYVFAVKKGMRILGITDDMVREMYSLQLISEEEFNKW
jgi:hypothetical protein